jgi:formamidopyrimidine-DNA glycosylase
MIAGRLHWRSPGAKAGGFATIWPPSIFLMAHWFSLRPARSAAHPCILSGEEALHSIDPGGIDVFSSDLNAFRAALTAENRTLKRALTDPRIVSGIGEFANRKLIRVA